MRSIIPTSSFWINNRVANACYKMYNIMAPHVRAKIDAFEVDQMERKTHSVDSAAVVLYNSIVVKMQDRLSSDRKTVMMSRKPFAKVIRYVTDYSVNTAQEQFAAWKALEEELLVKFIDGNVKPQNPDGTFKHSEYSKGQPEKIEWPGYTELWKETVAREAGEVLKVIRGLADQKTTMIIVTHEMAFARDVADQIIFMDGGVIAEQGTPQQVIDNPSNERTKQFLSNY